MLTVKPCHWMLAWASLAAAPTACSQEPGLQEILAEPVLAPNQPEIEAQVFASSRVPAGSDSRFQR